MADTETKVVQGSGGSKHRFRIARKKVMIGVLGLLVVALIAGGVIWYVTNKDDKSAPSKSAVRTVPTVEQHAFSPTEKVNGLIAIKKYDEALKVLDEAPSNQDNDGQRAIVYYSQGSYQKALDTYNAIDKKYGLRSSQAAYAGLSAEALGQNQLALSYYQKAKDIESKVTGPQRESNIRQYQKYIDAVNKKL
ncbi:MAG: hypothetical protein JWM37_137 [Candidatus Saccharibacteria bacterium]|nr:hypothetical protein [Candidatus Saccharibacteria bacterium]